MGAVPRWPTSCSTPAIEECPEDGVSIVSVSSTEVRPCIGCDECRAVAEEPIHVFEEGDPLLPQETVAESGALRSTIASSTTT